MNNNLMQDKLVLQRLDTLRRSEDGVLELGMQLFKSGGGVMFPLDFLAFAALKRNLSTTAAIVTLIEASNMLAARSMLRIHIDTALRFAAAWFTKDPQKFASEVHGGTRLDKLKDRDGNRFQDFHLVNLLSTEYPWLPEVYERLSGFVHFSDSHIFGAISSVSRETHEVQFELGKVDNKYPTRSWVEVIDCAVEATGILGHYLKGWIETKNMRPEELAFLKAQMERRS